MIDYLRGHVRHCESDFIVLDVNGIGYRVFCSNPFSFQQHSETETIVYIHYNVREDAVLLFGFASREEQSLFRRLLEVSGIGPRVALGVLSGGRPDMLIAAVQREDLAYLTRLPGIGKKTAQRIILDLKDKLAAVGAGTRDPIAGEELPAKTTGLPESNAVLQDAREALLALGFTEAEIDRIWPSVKTTMQEDDNSDRIMKLALQQLYKE